MCDEERWMKPWDHLDSRLPSHYFEPGWPWWARAGCPLSPPAQPAGLSPEGLGQPSDRGLTSARLSPLPGAYQGEGSAVSCLDFMCAAGPVASLFGWILLVTLLFLPSLIKAGATNLQGKQFYWFFKKTFYCCTFFPHPCSLSLKHSPVVWAWFKMLVFGQEGIREALPPLAHLY